MPFPAYETLFRLAPQASALLDADGRVCEVNDAYLAMVGGSREQLQGMPSERFLACDAEEAAEITACFRGACASGRPDQLVLRSGRSVQFQPLPGASAPGATMLQAVTSAPTLPLFTGQLAPGEDESSQRLRAVGRLACGVAHSFNNTLQVIGGNLQLLRRALGADLAAARRLDAALEGVERGGRLATQLLGYAMRPAGETALLDLAAQVGAMLDLLNAVLGQGAEVRLEASPALWSICADVAAVEDLLLELAACARQAVQGSGRFVVEIRNQRDEGSGLGDGVVLRMADLSFGEVRDRALGPWPPVAGAAASTAGGLDVVRHLVGKLGGLVRSAPGGGFGLEIWLPRAHGWQANSPAVPVASTIATPDAAARAGLRVLFIEDDPTLRMLTGEVMSELGHTVVLGGSAEEALARLAEEPFDVLFTDVGLPGMDGLELARRARAADPGLTVVIASGYMVDAAVEGLRGVHCVLKPYDIDGVRVLLEGIPARGDR